VLKETAKLFGQEISDDQALKILNENNSEFWSSSSSKFEIHKEEPIFEGQYSNECYQERIFEALDHFISKKNTNVLEDWNHLIFHLPYAFHGRRILVEKWTSWLDENNKLDQLTNEIGKLKDNDKKSWIKLAAKSQLYKNFVTDRIAPGEIASSEIGNMYTASIFMSLLSMMNNAVIEKIDLTNNKIGFISYGSGSKAKIFEGTVESNWKVKLKSSNLFSVLNKRIEINIDEYERLHKNSITEPINDLNDSIKLSKIQDGEFTKGLRSYKIN
jgi:hydroxymethylglutaryl-CoA synthase